MRLGPVSPKPPLERGLALCSQTSCSNCWGWRLLRLARPAGSDSDRKVTSCPWSKHGQGQHVLVWAGSQRPLRPSQALRHLWRQRWKGFPAHREPAFSSLWAGQQAAEPPEGPRRPAFPALPLEPPASHASEQGFPHAGERTIKCLGGYEKVLLPLLES